MKFQVRALSYFDAFPVMYSHRMSAYSPLQVSMVFLIGLGTVSLVSMASRQDTVLTLPFFFFHGIVHISVSLRYGLLKLHEKQEL
jgi:hypothetical protein